MSVSRLFVEADLAAGIEAPLGEAQVHYLRHVMRRPDGAPLLLFNGRDGEWKAALVGRGKKSAVAEIGDQTRVQAAEPDVWLCFAPVKRARIDYIAEKATELGVAVLQPVLTRHTAVERVNVERLRANAIEAAEQTERLDVPPIRDAAKLMTLLSGWDTNRVLLFADEAGDDAERPWGGEAGRARPADEVLRGLPDGPAAILIGPEGGFSAAERAQLRKQAFVRPVSLGPRILRAETAAVAVLALWQAIRGDWRG